MTERDRILANLSDAELLTWHGLFGTYPTADRMQRARLDRLLVTSREDVPGHEMTPTALRARAEAAAARVA